MLFRAFALLVCVPLVFCALEPLTIPPRLEACLLKLFLDPSNVGATALTEEVLEYFCSSQSSSAGGSVYNYSANVTMGISRWVTSLIYALTAGRRGTGFNAAAPRVRKEYRRLNDRERNNYHRAVNLLKRDTVGGDSFHLILSLY